MLNAYIPYACTYTHVLVFLCAKCMPKNINPAGSCSPTMLKHSLQFLTGEDYYLVSLMYHVYVPVFSLFQFHFNFHLGELAMSERCIYAYYIIGHGLCIFIQVILLCQVQ